jgi:DNA-binding GntR family transcriptional regulator
MEIECIMNIFKPTKDKDNSLTERVYRDLRHGIVTGTIRGGTRLIETTLASQMDVSRTPVREALHKLALEGFLYSIPRAGYIVEETSDTDIKDLFTTRTAIEQIAVKWAIEKISVEELHRLEKNLQKTDEVIKTGETESMMDLDAEFHEIIYRAARSKSLYRISQTLSDHTLRFRLACIHIPEDL